LKIENGKLKIKSTRPIPSYYTLTHRIINLIRTHVMKNYSLVAMLAAASIALTSLSACKKEEAVKTDGADASMQTGVKDTMAAAAPAATTPAATPAASQYPMVGGAEMFPTKDIVDNAVNSKDHTTLVAAVKAAGLVETLKGAGPFTVFAPTNEAFGKLPAGAVDGLVKPENKAALTKILTYHVVAGKHDAAEISKMIDDGKGKATFKTVAGGMLTATKSGNMIMLTDEKGGMSNVTIADVNQSNGVIHVVDAVMMPK
jgi:uncharacterized surface protein with fasciclin (FAS1) repeats